MSFKLFLKELSGNRVEGELIKSAFYSFIISAIIFLLFYFTKLKELGTLSTTAISMSILAVLSYSFLSPTIRQVKAYGQHKHGEGMMIGMTIGMLAGFLSGFFVGATNGMFVGSVFGMLVGICLGVYLGSCCGVMGVLEGAMAGFMGGLMGAMTAVMTLTDHIIILGIFIFLISAFITVSLSYMIYLSSKNRKYNSQSYSKEVIISTILFLLTIIIMVFGPRSFLFT